MIWDVFAKNFEHQASQTNPTQGGAHLAQLVLTAHFCTQGGLTTPNLTQGNANHEFPLMFSKIRQIIQKNVDFPYVFLFYQ